MFQALAIQNGQELMSDDGLTTYFDAPATVEALEFWKSLSVEHGIMPEGAMEWSTLRQAFPEGETAMMWHSTGNLTAVKDNAGFDFGFAMLPARERLGSPAGGGDDGGAGAGFHGDAGGLRLRANRIPGARRALHPRAGRLGLIIAVLCDNDDAT